MMNVEIKRDNRFNFFGLLERSARFYLDVLGYKPEHTSLKNVSEKRWTQFTQNNGFNLDSSGIYAPRNQTSIVRNKNLLSLFHEYFGHGLFCEQSLIGRKLVNLERELLEEEKQEFLGKNFSLDDLKLFRQRSKTFHELSEFRDRNLGVYELFAIWTEYLLSNQFGLRESFERKYSLLKGKDRQVIDASIDFTKEYGSLATFYHYGLSKRTTPERIRNLLRDIYKSKLDDVKFVLLYGSRKEFSDIDIFAVSETLPQIGSWLDVRVYGSVDFTKRLGLFDIAVTNPLMTGEFVVGDRDYFEEQKKRFFSQPITERTISYNITEGVNQRKLAGLYPSGSIDNLRGIDYSITYLNNAEAMRNGVRLFAKKDLISYSNRASVEDDKPLQLQGGKQNAT